ncbi:hypothetical protein E1B28_007507 [Marasmius oreades]|uniref:Uncharacterized protein n=1 Tax=Marasmius oreades TaxID=181124 RepID=A0A9P7S1U8_9AGAR|nr:uncharacterized protein E1B28_007507 [Marasmius oreades]KAG7093869.1 hypothetical protein E1B28_007507 [Marasmius oreades]
MCTIYGHLRSTILLQSCNNIFLLVMSSANHIPTRWEKGFAIVTVFHAASSCTPWIQGSTASVGPPTRPTCKVSVNALSSTVLEVPLGNQRKDILPFRQTEKTPIKPSPAKKNMVITVWSRAE